MQSEPSVEKSDVEDETLPCSSKTAKRTYHKGGKPVVEEKPLVKSKPNTSMSNASSAGLASSDNVVNYKPFSCHVCGDNFASDNALLEHIKTHGEGAAKCFKCKFCGDEFDDIYKMQYHLAICPLAEDELESTFNKSTPIHFMKRGFNQNSIPTVSNGIPLLRKRGRPRKTMEVTPVKPNENTENDLTPSLSTRGSLRKRKKIEEPAESVIKIAKVTCIPLPKRRGRRNKSLKALITEPTPDNESLDYIDEMVNEDADDITERDPLGVDNNIANPNDGSFEIGEDDRKKVHSCPFPRCGIKFTREKALLCHMRNHSDDFDDALKCHKCDIPFDDIQSLRAHINVCKGIKEERDDDFDEPDYTDTYDPEDRPFHTFQRTKGEFMCKTCGRTYLTQEKLKSHNCHGGNPLSMKFPCRLCGEELTNQKSLKNHFKISHPHNLQFQCPTCLQEFDDLKEVNDHVLGHLKSSFECAVCLEKVRSKAELQKHYLQEHPGTDRSICLICNRKYSDPSGLAKHRHVHTGERPYTCPFCSMSFTLKSSQVVHIRRHTNYRPYKCNICPKAFFNSGDLKKHSRFHTGERPYQCDICKARFSLRECLNNHLRRHLSVRPFKCPECPKAFNNKTSLKYHMPLHTGVRPFQCPLCSESYFQMGSLRTHVRKRHINEFASNASFISCQICGVIKADGFKMTQHLMTHRSDHISNVDQQASLTARKSKAVNVRKKRKRQRKNETVITIRKRGRPRKVQNMTVKSRLSETQNYQQSDMCPVQTPEILPATKTEPTSDDELNYEYSKINIDGPNTGVQEVAAFEPFIKAEMGCSMCMEVFDSYERLLDHVYIHI